MAPLVFEAPPQDVLVRPVPATLGVRSFHRFPAYVPLTSHRFLRAEWSQQEGMSEHRRPCQFGGALGSGAGESGRARAAHGGSCKICLLRAVHRARFRMGIALSATSEGLREATRHLSGVALRRLRLPLPPASDWHPRRGFITPSRLRPFLYALFTGVRGETVWKFGIALSSGCH